MTDVQAPEAPSDDALAARFDRHLVRIIEERVAEIEAGTGDGTALLRQGLDATRPTDIPALARMRQRLAAGVIECMLLSRLSLLHRTFPDPHAALIEPATCRALAGVGQNEIEAAGPALGGAITAAVRDSEVTGLDTEGWLYVLSCLLIPARPHLPLDNVVDITTAQIGAAVLRGGNFD